MIRSIISALVGGLMCVFCAMLAYESGLSSATYDAQAIRDEAYRQGQMDAAADHWLTEARELHEVREARELLAWYKAQMEARRRADEEARPWHDSRQPRPARENLPSTTNF